MVTTYNQYHEPGNKILVMPPSYKAPEQAYGPATC